VRQRSISAVGVVIVAVVPAIAGGPIFAAVLTLLCLIGLHEYNAMARRIGNRIAPIGFVALIGFALVALFDGGSQSLLGVCAFAVGTPLVWVIFRPDLDRAFLDWALIAAGALYLGLPLFAVIALRDLDGSISAGWLEDASTALSFGWAAHPRGLAWLLFVIVVTWLSDTGAYLIGRVAGHRPLIPRISPKKTVEGFAGGLACAGIAAVVANAAFGLEGHSLVMLGVGLVLAVIGVVGDLAESLIKRQAGVKDSGTLIPGHGGMLDRLDALLFTWTAGWFAAATVDRWF
jgi:phosphatidate cytidylyltransferase